MSNATEQTVFVRNLIDAVREHRCLYDKKDTAYFNRREKEKAWHAIGQQLGRSDVACHRRWKLLREKFAKELKKRDHALKNGEHFQSDWTCFSNIMYIKEHIAPRKKNSEKLPFVLKKSISPTKRMIYEQATSADTTTENHPYCPTGLDFLAQLSKATLQAAQLSDSNSFSERNLQADTKIETAEAQFDELHSATIELGSPTSTDSDSESSASVALPDEAATTLNSTHAVDALLRELRTNKESSLNFVKNLTNALKINNSDMFKEVPQPVAVLPQSSLKEDNTLHKVPAQKCGYVPEVVSPLKDAHEKDEVVRNTLLRVNGMNNPVNKVPAENPSMEVTSTASQPTNDLRDEIFGKMVVTMLGDITDEECKDDAKFGIMQVLINAKRACRNKQITRQ